MHNFKPINSFISFKVIEKQLEDAYEKGELSREKAHRILKNAKRAYRNQDYNKTIEKVNHA